MRPGHGAAKSVSAGSFDRLNMLFPYSRQSGRLIQEAAVDACRRFAPRGRDLFGTPAQSPPLAPQPRSGRSYAVPWQDAGSRAAGGSLGRRGSSGYQDSKRCARRSCVASGSQQSGQWIGRGPMASRFHVVAGLAQHTICANPSYSARLSNRRMMSCQVINCNAPQASSTMADWCYNPVHIIAI